MIVSDFLGCRGFPCRDVDSRAYSVPGVPIEPERVKVVVVSEAAPRQASDGFYAPGDPLFARTTLQAFSDAGLEVRDISSLLGRGFYFTTAVKCAKKGYAIAPDTVKVCSNLLERELDLFPAVVAIMLMGDVAIRSFNEVARRKTGSRAIPAGPTYKIRSATHSFRGVRLFPSYLQAGPSFFIERSKRRMIAQDIAEALRLYQGV